MTGSGKQKNVAEIERFLEELSNRPWLGPARSWWPRYVFRTDDVEAAAKILNSGKILSREAAAAQGLLANDAADGGVIAGTPEEFRKCVRLYLRPKTPTQYRNEGIRPVVSIYNGAHCPVPVVLLLDAKNVMGRADASFSDGNLGKTSRVQVGNDVEFLRALPFQKIYHDSAFSQAERDEIIFHRHAEVFIPDELPIGELVRVVGCRSQAEFQTLWSLLTPSARALWRAKMAAGAKYQLHYRRWFFVRQVSMEPEKVTFEFSSSVVRGPFRVRMDIESKSARQYWAPVGDYTFGDVLTINLKTRPPPGSLLTLRLDGRLAYRSEYGGIDVPF